MKAGTCFRSFAGYRPQKPLLFSDRKMLIYSNPDITRYSYIIQASLYGVTSYLAYKIAFTSASMGWFSWLFQGSLLFGGYTVSKIIYEFSSKTALKVYLRADGKTIEVHSALISGAVRMSEAEVIAIGDITTGNSEDIENLLFLKHFGVPQYITTKKNHLFYVMPGGNIPDGGLLRAVLTGSEIDLSESDKIDVIDV